MLIIPDGNMAAIITAIQLQLGTAVTGLLHVHLYTNLLTPTKSNVRADFFELTILQCPGYAAKSINWYAGVPFRTPLGAWEDPSSLADPSFIATGPPPIPVQVFGYFLTDSTDAILLGSGVFAIPFTFTFTGDGLTLEGNPSLNQPDASSIQLTFPDLQPA